ncbi:MAG TPA: non-homologous end-joining DNA ligase, partial [Gammaproteobacteria bacterium]|nr:non-homologous end-joining DNA ligase [Gammaproteobacteria bacterium]
MALEQYYQKRDFAKTGEPRGKAGKKAGNHFVVQHHEASREHYDFRLELDGVLKSWAVPKGPSLDPQQKRLAVHVEDHPLEYADFEGIIPQGEYGGGTVMVWDRGTWQADSGDKRDTLKAYKAGKLSFRLRGEKLHGGWALVRMRGKEKADNWLLIKEKDDTSDPETDITDEQPDSVLSGRAMRDISKDHDRIWSSDGELSEDKPETISQAKKTKFPANIKPQLATLVDKPPKGNEWLHEIKLDGYRILAYKNKNTLSLLTRNQNEYNKRFPAVTKALKQLPVDTAVMDGEVVFYGGDGKTDFHELKRVMHHGDASQLIYVAFDLLYLDGYNLRRAPLFERKHLLRALLAKEPNNALRYSDHLDMSGSSVYEKACELRLEGIISKRRDQAYHSGRNRDWQKTKCLHEQEFVIAGFSDPQGARSGFGALLLGYYADNGLQYAGRVGTGFDDDMLKRVSKKLRKREQKKSPYAHALTTAQKKNVHWVKPELVGQIEFTEWTKDGRLRHPAFQGLREDKDPRQIVREIPQ